MKRFLGRAVRLAGPAIAGFAVGGPAGAGAAVVAQVSGAAEKSRSVRAEATGSAPLHKATAPAAAVAAPTLLAVVLGLFGVSEAATVSGLVCGSPALSAGLVGALSVFVHEVGKGIETATVRRVVGS